MKNLKKYQPLFALAAALLLIPTLPAVAQDAGTVVFAKGDVTAERQPPEPLAKGDAVRQSDEVVTGAASRAQLQMTDGAKIAMRPNSRLRIDEYSYTPPAAASVSASTDKSVMTIVKGGFRTITGAIGKQNQDDYEVRTPVGVLGIRGTSFAVLLCGGDCGAGVANGLYIAVTDGVIAFTTSRETIIVRAGEYVFIPLEVPVPQRLDEPPAIMLDDNDFTIDPATSRQPGDESATGDTSGFNSRLGTRRAPDPADPDSSDPGKDPAGSSGSETPKQPTIATDPDGSPVDITPGTQPPPNDPRTIAFSGGPLGQFDQVTNAVGDNAPGQFQLGAANSLTRFDVSIAGRTGADVITWDIGSAANVETGFDTVTVMRWGRWSGGTITGTSTSGTSDTITLTAPQSLHWIMGPESAPPVMQIQGIANYTLVGSTSPTDNFGNAGTLGSATFQADFTSMLVTSTLDLTIMGDQWVASGTGTIGAQAGLADHLFQGFYNSVVVDGATGGFGSFSGFFSEAGPTSNPAFPGGVGLSYSLQDANGTQIVSGAAAFGNP
jgi:hypothetical protein